MKSDLVVRENARWPLLPGCTGRLCWEESCACNETEENTARFKYELASHARREPHFMGSVGSICFKSSLNSYNVVISKELEISPADSWICTTGSSLICIEPPLLGVF
jgi:hypothetical protein